MLQKYIARRKTRRLLCEIEEKGHGATMLETRNAPGVELAGTTSGPSKRDCLARGEGSRVSRSCLAIAKLIEFARRCPRRCRGDIRRVSVTGQRQNVCR